MNGRHPLSASAFLAILVLSACGAPVSEGGGGDPGVPTVPTVPTGPADEVVDMNYVVLSDRGAPGTADMIYRVLNGQTPASSDSVTFTYMTGAVSGGLLDATDIDDAAYTNPANGEYSRVVRITGDNLFGVVGLDVLSGDIPAAGSVTNYNEGWIGLTAIFENNVYVLEGDAILTATWGTGQLDASFVNLSGRDATDQAVTRVGNIILDNANISGDTFVGGSVTGTGLFAPLGGSSSTAGTTGAFFGPQADEVGGVLLINDATADIRVLGAFQAD